MRSDRPLVALVDAYGTGRDLQRAFLDLGADVVHVSSTEEPLTSMKAPNLGECLASLVCSDPEVTAKELDALRPVTVVAGQEPGVLLADVLSEMLGLPTNGTALSPARRDKYLMIEALRRAGLRCADQFRSSDVETVVEWAQRRGQYPVVVKPLAASGSQGVAICVDAEQVRHAAQAILGTTTMYAQVNTEVLVQSYLPGTEYVVDIVSWARQRYTCGVWRYQKRRQGNHNVYHLMALVPPDDPVVAELTSYVHEVLDALGIQHGAAHAEVMMTPDGPALVEIGARMNGGMLPAYDRECCGADQATLTALAYLRPQEFLARYAGGSYQLRREAVVYDVETELEGVLARIDDDVLAELHGVESVREVVLKVRPGDRLRPTTDLPSSPMTIHLCNTSMEGLMRDHHRVTALSKQAFHLA